MKTEWHSTIMCGRDRFNSSSGYVNLSLDPVFLLLCVCVLIRSLTLVKKTM